MSARMLVWNKNYYQETPQATVRAQFDIVSRNNSNHSIVLDAECRLGVGGGDASGGM